MVFVLWREREEDEGVFIEEAQPEDIAGPCDIVSTRSDWQVEKPRSFEDPAGSVPYSALIVFGDVVDVRTRMCYRETVMQFSFLYGDDMVT